MSTARFALSVLVPTPFAYHPFRGRVSLLLLGEQLPHVDVAQVDPDRTVHQPAGHRVGLHAAAETAVPAGRRVLRAEDGGSVHVEQLVRVISAILRGSTETVAAGKPR